MAHLREAPVSGGWPPVVVGGIALCAFVGGVSDLAQPIAPFAAIIAIVSTIALALNLIVLFVLRDTRHRTVLAQATGVIGMLALTSVGVRAWQMAVPDGNASGVIASGNQAIRDLQSSFFDIDKKISRIEGKIDTTVEAGNIIVGTTQRIEKGLSTVKKETSEDPLKELANLGVAASERKAAWQAAMRERNVRLISLIIASGYTPDSLEIYHSLGWKGPAHSEELTLALTPISKELSATYCGAPTLQFNQYFLLLKYSLGSGELEKIANNIGVANWKRYCSSYLPEYEKQLGNIKSSIAAASKVEAQYDECIKKFSSREIAELRSYYYANRYFPKNAPKPSGEVQSFIILGGYGGGRDHTEGYCREKFPGNLSELRNDYERAQRTIRLLR